MKKKLALKLLSLLCVLCCTVGVTACNNHTHNLTLVPQKAVSCTKDGVKSAYYVCSGCDKWFSDENGQNEITDKSSVILPKTNHNFSNGICTNCQTKEPTAGLAYTVNNGHVEVSKGTLNADHPVNDIVIADFYDGKPVEYVAYDAFKNCAFIQSVTIPDTVHTIKSRAFYKCENLTTVTMSDSVTSIGGQAFYLCNKLTDIKISKNVTDVWSEAFLGCSSLQSVTIPDNVKKIHDNAFKNCSSLTSVIIPKSVTEIGEGAFGGPKVYYKGTAADWANVEVSSTNNTWNDSENIYFYSEAQPASSGNFWHFNTDGVTPVKW